LLIHTLTENHSKVTTERQISVIRPITGCVKHSLNSEMTMGVQTVHIPF